MTNDNLYTPYRGPKWEIGKLSIGFHSHEDILALAESFIQTESFLDAVGYILKRVDVVFGLRPIGAEAIQASIDPPPPDQVYIVTHKLVAVYLAWQIASDLNPSVAAFTGDMLEDLRNEIHRVDRDAIDAVCDGTELQKIAAAYTSRKNINSAFYKLHRELGIHRGKYYFLRRVSDQVGLEDGGTVSGSSEEDNSVKTLNAGVKPTSASPLIENKPYLGLVFQHDSTVKRIGYEGNLSIQLAPQRLKLLKFVHEAGKDGRTQSEIVPMIILDMNTLTSEKNRIKEDLRTFDIDLGPRGQYVVRCTRIANKKTV